MAAVDGLPLESYYLFHAVRADLLRRARPQAEAAIAYESALARTDNEAERAFLERARAAVTEPPGR